MKQLFREGLQLIKQEAKHRYLEQYFPVKPKILNLLINDVCNAKCQMCCIWQRKKDKEITPAELAAILADPLFDQLNYIGVSGGEPTLRDDLSELFTVLVAKRPEIDATGLITNGLNAKRSIANIEAATAVCRKAGINFNLMLSLDGIGDTHDSIRGRTGAFDNIVEVLSYFKNRDGINLLVGCTVSKNNVWEVAAVKDFCQKNRVQASFRIAEFIDRLYNVKQTEVIRNFSPLEEYHLGLFFDRLYREEGEGSKRKQTYLNIRKMLLQKKKRGLGCHWQSTAISLDCRGQLFYCSPHSPMLGDTTLQSAEIIYRKGIPQRREVLKSFCRNCIHDYGAARSFNFWLEEKRSKYWKEKLSLEKVMAVTGEPQGLFAKKRKLSTKGRKRYLVVGWYGTETAGDKAILAEIVFQLRQVEPLCSLVLASINPYYSKWTIAEPELGLADVKIIETFSSELGKEIGRADEVIMGGGPLMNLNALGLVLWSFFEAKKVGKRTRIAGCGIGPLLRESIYERAVVRVIGLADRVELRDHASLEWARKRVAQVTPLYTGDPAAGFVRRWKIGRNIQAKDKWLNLYLREWSLEYQGEMSKEEFFFFKDNFENQLAAWIRALCERLKLRPRLLAMHHFHIGRDDRDFNRWLADRYLGGVEPVVEEKPMSVVELLRTMMEGDLALCMRFHSVLFAFELEIPFLAVDYTRGGKIKAFLEDKHDCARLVSMQDIVGGEWRRRLSRECFQKDIAAG